MTREEKCLLAIERGFTYNPETGKIYNRYNKELNYLNNTGYISFNITLNKKSNLLLGHHFAWYWVYKVCDFEQLDHINGIRTDNRIKNLRCVNNQQNSWNRVNCKGYVLRKRDNIFNVRIMVDNKNKHIGCFKTEQEARDAYLKAKEKYHVI